MKYLSRISFIFAMISSASTCSFSAYAAPPTREDIDVYTSLCRIGSAWNFDAGGELGLIGKRILAGQGEVAVSELRDEFPGISLEENRLVALTAFQECMYRYVERFHPGQSAEFQQRQSVVGPESLPDRRREIVFVANQLEDFKKKMARVKASLPESHYLKRTATTVTPLEDMRLIGLENYGRYKAFQSPGGLLDFTRISNNDLALICDTFEREVSDYSAFVRDLGREFRLSPYVMSSELRRICKAAERGR